jgi:hypothetical protein
LDDRGTIVTIKENMYMQYLHGIEEYTYEDVFNHSLFTMLRYRMGADKFDTMTRQIIMTSQGKHEAARKDLDGNPPENPAQRENSPEKDKTADK